MDVKKLISGGEVSREETASPGKRDSKVRREQRGSKDRVSLSARHLSPEEAAELAASQAAEQTARAKKVQQLREAVRSGAYSPDIREVARNLLFSDFKPLED
ncbi:flagellar biosynthesis anti-sigma factor FlgM [Megalodesulfovibrio paquesii]